jgi:bifunctional DNA-binding transcriptional regulator/antitoxin component of YhaV-PrlF toxin-antitoxin module
MSTAVVRSLPPRRTGTITLPQDARERLDLHEGDNSPV